MKTRKTFILSFIILILFTDKVSSFSTLSNVAKSFSSVFYENVPNSINGNVQLLAGKKDKNTKSKNKNPSTPQETPDEMPSNVTEIKINKNKKKSHYFSNIPDTVLADVEIGSPDSIRKAISSLRKASVDYTPNEKVLLFICTEIMRIAYPSEKIDFIPPQTTEDTPYTGALLSAKNGYYDTNTGNVDFLATVLPSLVLCTSNVRNDYYEQSLADLKSAETMRQNSVLLSYLLGLLYIRLNRAQDALNSFKKAAASSNAIEILYNQALVLRSLGRIEESSELQNQLIVRSPSDVNVLKLCAMNAFDAADYIQAERYASLVLQKNPSDLEFVLFRAKIFVQTGEYLKATSLLDVYSKSNTTSKDYLLLRAKIQREWNKNLSVAVSTITTALKLYPTDADIILYAAILASETGAQINGRSGSELVQEILLQDSTNTQARSFLIKTLIKEKKWKEAYNSSKLLLSTNARASLDLRAAHIQICLALRYNDEAWKEASSLYELYPTEEKAVQSYIQVLIATGRTAQATRLINSMLTDASSSMKSFLYYERSFISSGEEAQLVDLRSSLIANPRNSDALFRMYSIYFSKKDYRKAQYYLRQVVALNPNDQTYLRLNSELESLLK